MTDEQTWQLEKFISKEISIVYPRAYQAFIRECLLYDVYRTDLLRYGDIVADLGATVGEFTIKAAKKVGTDGVVIAIEPNPLDFELLRRNAESNKCDNIILVNKGVGSTSTEKDISFRGRDFRAKIDTLGDILKDTGLTHDIDFIKMDIEGAESEVARADIDTLRMAEVISVELHNTKNEFDNILEANGFVFEPLSTMYCIKKLVRNTLFSQPGYLINTVSNSIKRDPMIWYKLLFGQDKLEGYLTCPPSTMDKITQDPTQPHLLTGTYIQRNSTRRHSRWQLTKNNVRKDAEDHTL